MFAASSSHACSLPLGAMSSQWVECSSLTPVYMLSLSHMVVSHCDGMLLQGTTSTAHHQTPVATTPSCLVSTSQTSSHSNPIKGTASSLQGQAHPQLASHSKLRAPPQPRLQQPQGRSHLPQAPISSALRAKISWRTVGTLGICTLAWDPSLWN